MNNQLHIPIDYPHNRDFRNQIVLIESSTGLPLQYQPENQPRDYIPDEPTVGTNEIYSTADRLKTFNSYQGMVVNISENQVTTIPSDINPDVLVNIERRHITNTPVYSSELDIINNLLENYVATSNVDFSHLISDRIKKLYRIRNNEDVASLNIGSLKYFLKYISSNTKLNRPSIVLTINGNIYCRWAKDDFNLIAIEFMPEGMAKYIIFHPNRKHDDIVDRISALTTVDEVYSKISSEMITHWES